MRQSEHHASDTTPSRDVASRYRDVIRRDDHDASLALLHYRGGEEEFRIGKEYCASNDPGDRATGADILAQLGWGDQTFREESIEILLPLLDDSDLYVIYCAAVALGHRKAESAIPALMKLAKHPDPLVRYGVVFGLSGLEDTHAIAALIKLASDEDHDVRNWAVFGLGSLIDADSPEMREAFRRALSDPDPEIRGEALVGLARRGDPAIVPELLRDWKDDAVSILSLEAAEESRDTRLYPHLQEFTKILALDDNPYFADRLADAIAACKPSA